MVLDPVDMHAQHRTPGEDRREPVAVDRRGDQEPQSVAVPAPQPGDHAEEPAIGLHHRDLLLHLVLIRGGHLGQQQRQGEDQMPDSRHHGHRADVDGVIGADAQKIALDQRHVADQQQDDPAHIAGAPADAGDPAHPLVIGDVGDHRVVVQVRELIEDPHQCHQRHAQQQEAFLRADEEAGGHHDQHHHRVDREPEPASSCLVGALTDHRSGERDDGARQCSGHRKVLRAPVPGLRLRGSGQIEDSGGQVGAEDEGCHHRADRGVAPAPEAPGRDDLLVQRLDAPCLCRVVGLTCAHVRIVVSGC